MQGAGFAVSIDNVAVAGERAAVDAAEAWMTRRASLGASAAALICQACSWPGTSCKGARQALLHLPFLDFHKFRGVTLDVRGDMRPAHASPDTGYDADGAVLKLDDAVAAAALGVTAAGDPRSAVAWKFPAGEAVTRLEGVELTVGRAGQVRA